MLQVDKESRRQFLVSTPLVATLAGDTFHTSAKGKTGQILQSLDAQNIERRRIAALPPSLDVFSPTVQFKPFTRIAQEDLTLLHATRHLTEAVQGWKAAILPFLGQKKGVPPTALPVNVHTALDKVLSAERSVVATFHSVVMPSLRPASYSREQFFHVVLDQLPKRFGPRGIFYQMAVTPYSSISLPCFVITPRIGVVGGVSSFSDEVLGKSYRAPLIELQGALELGGLPVGDIELWRSPGNTALGSIFVFPPLIAASIAAIRSHSPYQRDFARELETRLAGRLNLQMSDAQFGQTALFEAITVALEASLTYLSLQQRDLSSDLLSLVKRHELAHFSCYHRGDIESFFRQRPIGTVSDASQALGELTQRAETFAIAVELSTASNPTLALYHLFARILSAGGATSSRAASLRILLELVKEIPKGSNPQIFSFRDSSNNVPLELLNILRLPELAQRPETWRRLCESVTKLGSRAFAG